MQNNKNTIYISSYDDIKNPHYGGGGAVAIHEVAKRLSKLYDVHVLSWNYSGKTKETIDGVSYERFGLKSLSPKASMFAYQLGLPFVALRKNYDIWMESYCPPFTTAFLPVFIKKPVVGIVHMLAAEDMERKYKLPFHLIQNSGLQKYKHILVTSDALKKKVEAITPTSSVTVVSNGITNVSNKNPRKQKYVLFLGRIEVDQKGLDILVNAFQLFHKMHPEYKLLIAGTGDQKEIAHFRSLIAQASLTKVVQLKGRVSGKTKETLLQQAACIVIPSRFETYSLVALEAMAHGAPIVCFAINGLSWIPTKIAKKVTLYDSRKLANAITTVVTNKTIADSMKKAGKAYAKNFTWDVIAKKYETYLNQL